MIRIITLWSIRIRCSAYLLHTYITSKTERFKDVPDRLTDFNRIVEYKVFQLQMKLMTRQILWYIMNDILLNI